MQSLMQITSDFFFVWNKRNGFIPDQFPDSQTPNSVVPKQEELIQHTARFGGSEDKAKAYYTHGMTRAFEKAHYALSDDAPLVIVFAHKEPEAWETLLTTAIIGAGFIVTASWPIDTEKANRVRRNELRCACTSLWLVCRKRPARARVGYYNKVRGEMQERITERLRYFWDARNSGTGFRLGGDWPRAGKLFNL